MQVKSLHNRPINFGGLFELVPGVNEVPGDLIPNLEKMYLWDLMKTKGALKYLEEKKPKVEKPVKRKKKDKKVEF